METRGRKPTPNKAERSRRLRELRIALGRTQAFLSARAPWYFKHQVWVKCEGGRANAMTSSDAILALSEVFGVKESEVRDYLAGKIALPDMLTRVDQTLLTTSRDVKAMAAERMIRDWNLSEFTATAIKDDPKWNAAEYEKCTEEQWYKLFMAEVISRGGAAVQRSASKPKTKDAATVLPVTSAPAARRKSSTG